MSSYSSVQKLFDRKHLSTLRKAWEVEDEKFFDTMGLLTRTYKETRDQTLEEIATIRDAEVYMISVFTAMVSVLVLVWLLQPVLEGYFDAFVGNMIIKTKSPSQTKKGKQQQQQQPKGSSSGYDGMLQGMTPSRMMEVQQHQKRQQQQQQQQKQKQQSQQRRQQPQRRGGLWGLIKSLFRYIIFVFAYMKASMKTFPSWSIFTGWWKSRKSNAAALADQEQRRKEQRLNELLREYKRASLVEEFQNSTERLHLELGMTAPLTRSRRLQDRMHEINEKRRRGRSQPARPTTPVPEMITPNRASSNRARVEVMKGNQQQQNHNGSSLLRSDAAGDAGATTSEGDAVAHSSANRIRMEMLLDSTPPSETMIQGKTANRVIVERLKSGNGTKSKNVDGEGSAAVATKISSSQKIADFDAVPNADADDEANNASSLLQENSKMVRFGDGGEDDENPQKHLLHPDTVKGILHTKPKYNGNPADEKKVNVRSMKHKENRFVPPIRNRLSLQRLRRR